MDWHVKRKLEQSAKDALDALDHLDPGSEEYLRQTFAAERLVASLKNAEDEKD